MTTAYLSTLELSQFATNMNSEDEKAIPTRKRGRPSKSASTHNAELTQLFSSPISTSSSSSEAVRKYGSPKGSPLMRILKEGKKSSPLRKREMLPPNLKISPELKKKRSLPILSSPTHYDYRSHVNPSLLLSSPTSTHDITFTSSNTSMMSPLTPHSHFANVVQSSPMYPGYIVSTCSDLEEKSEKTRPKIEKSVSSSVVETPKKRPRRIQTTFSKECKLQLRIGQDGKARVATETCMASRPLLSHHLSMQEVECHLKLASDPVLAGAASDDDLPFPNDSFDGLNPRDGICDAKQALLKALKEK